MELKGKKILISGGTGGIGIELVKKLTAVEASLFVLGKSQEKLDNLKAQYRNISGTLAVDFNKGEELKKVLEQLPRDIDILINCQGIGNYKFFEDLTEEDWDESFNINLKSIFLLTKFFIREMASREGSVIFNIGSRSGVEAISTRSLYSATKFALRGFSLSLSEEFRGRRPFFCLLTLGSTLTEFGPMTIDEKIQKQKDGKKYLDVEFVGSEIIKILSDDNRKTEYVLNPSE